MILDPELRFLVKLPGVTALLVASALVGSVTTAAPASSAVRAANGAICTNVGTSGADTLTGTAGRDVICGLGGNDRLSGAGGDDVLDGGSGADSLAGGVGHDVLLGGLGSDVLGGADGNDRLLGGDGRDRILGGNGNDSVSGGASGDNVAGGAGSDTLSGRIGDDILTGGTGDDRVVGGSGNDDLDGGAGRDGIDGGDGTNWCTVDPLDTTRDQCVHDVTKPTAELASVTPTVVDVTSAPKRAVVRVRVMDDTGIVRVQFNAQDMEGGAAVRVSEPLLVSGTVRDGIWEGIAMVPQWSPPGTLDIHVFATDRVRRSGDGDFVDALTVVDRNPDTELPRVAALSITSSTGALPVDVRSADRTVTVSATITDDASGADYVSLCLDRPTATGYGQSGACGNLRLVSGTGRDGIWRGTMTIARGSVGGNWNVRLNVFDNAHVDDSTWYGPDTFPQSPEHCPECSDPRVNQLPGGSGRFAVLGTWDSTPPVLKTVTISPATVSTLAGPATVTVSVRATDAEGILRVGASPSALEPWDGPPDIAYVELDAPTSGTRTDGVWRLRFTLPQGFPSGKYPLQIWVEDLTHWRSHVTPTSWYAQDPDQIVLGPAELGTSDGAITVASD